METTFHFSFILLFLFVQTYGASSNNTMITASSNVTCIQRERQSLLAFRQGLSDKSNQLSTWTGVECCEWRGVGCDRRTGHVVKLDLRSPSSLRNYYSYTLNTSNRLQGKVSPSLLNLKHLRHLDLSMNNFSGQNIPEFFGSFKYLEYLNFSHSGFSGVVPPHLGNLSRLQYLDLRIVDRYNMISSPGDVSLMVKDDMRWVSLLTSLKHLDLSGITMGNHIDWLHPVNMLPSLLTLKLALCDINIASIKVINFTSLNSLDLSYNHINSTIPIWLSNLTGLVHLDLFNNSFHGGIPDSIGTLNSLSSMDLTNNQLSGLIPPSLGGLSSLTLLSLSGNKLSGNIPTSLGQLSNLQSLGLSFNQLSGNIPTSLGQLSNLQELYLQNNQLSGVVSEDHFTKLYNLTTLSLSGNSLITWNVSPHWIPPFQLEYLDASSCCNMGHQFPNWLQTQTHLIYLQLSNSSIRYSIPEWFHNIFSYLQVLDLSDNQIRGNLPRFNSGLKTVNLGKNRFSGSVPSHLCKLLSIQILNLSNNNLSGFLSKCLGNLIQLLVMDLTNNTITGDVPNSLGSLSYLQSLHLHNNKFEGNLPVALQNLTSLVTFDLGNNLLTCNIPSWIGKRLSKLRILNLQSNKFMGEIPSELCQINDLQHLNLTNNSITGNIPHCFCYLTGMIRSEFNFTYDNYGYTENIEAYIKGIELKYTKTIRFFVSLDLSSNKINGEIPDVLMNLISLKNLNLSRNQLSGHIPKRIGNLKSLESLDLSTNKLSGRIPPSLASMNYLSYLNLSFNKLFGLIPIGNQFNTFNDPTMYEGNNRLCGKPLPRNCNGSNTHVGDGKSKDSSHSLSWFYTGMVSGFVIGFMGLIASLHFIRIWRITYFETIENVCSWLTVLILVTRVRLKRKSF